ncbi:MAG: ATP-binding protein [Eubacteriales bacterium]|nr:ATP-binding protein [Eubacteriales bacterium]
MADGTIIQNRDISNISSTRRNPVLADIFGRLGYMERQGSGFRKITEAYYAAHNFRAGLEPKFYSDAVSFQVTLYNLNYGQSKPVEEEKQAIESTETVDSYEKQAIEQLIAALDYTQITKKHMIVLLNSFGGESVFGRTEVAKILQISVSPAGELISKMRSAELIEPVSGYGKGKYRFRQIKQ